MTLYQNSAYNEIKSMPHLAISRHGTRARNIELLSDKRFNDVAPQIRLARIPLRLVRMIRPHSGPTKRGYSFEVDGRVQILFSPVDIDRRHMIFGKHFVVVIADDHHCVRRNPLERFCHRVHSSLNRFVTLRHASRVICGASREAFCRYSSWSVPS